MQASIFVCIYPPLTYKSAKVFSFNSCNSPGVMITNVYIPYVLWPDERLALIAKKKALSHFMFYRFRCIYDTFMTLLSCRNLFRTIMNVWVCSHAVKLLIGPCQSLGMDSPAEKKTILSTHIKHCILQIQAGEPASCCIHLGFCRKVSSRFVKCVCVRWYYSLLVFFAITFSRFHPQLTHWVCYVCLINEV